ncbi:MAG: glycoside hydrolase family 3 protein, partial [Acholeplasmataceae bacterium]
MKKTLIFISLIMVLVISACTTQLVDPPIETPNQQTEETHIDPTIDENTPTDIDEAVFVETLLEQLTLSEKVGQMLQAEKNYITPEEVKAYNIGSILSGGGSFPNNFDDGPDVWYNMVKTFQEAALESSSEIPLLFGIDAVHGHNNAYGATIFPHNINLGMTRNAELMRLIGIATAKEVKSTGIHWNFSPAVSVTDDIRWGRTYESFSEDASIHQLFISAYIEGLQSYDVMATAKHFIADGATFNGIDQGDVILSEAEIRERHLPPYIDAIEAGVESIMISFSSINGLKMHGSKYWITDVLKDELGFDGIILSDWNATFQLPGDFRTQLSSAINAGIDMLMLP